MMRLYPEDWLRCIQSRQQDLCAKFTYICRAAACAGALEQECTGTLQLQPCQHQLPGGGGQNHVCHHHAHSLRKLLSAPLKNTGDNKLCVLLVLRLFDVNHTSLNAKTFPVWHEAALSSLAVLRPTTPCGICSVSGCCASTNPCNSCLHSCL